MFHRWSKERRSRGERGGGGGVGSERECVS